MLKCRQRIAEMAIRPRRRPPARKVARPNVHMPILSGGLMQSFNRTLTGKFVPLIATLLLLILALAANSAAQAAPGDAPPQAGPTPKGSGPSGPSGPATTIRTV